MHILIISIWLGALSLLSLTSCEKDDNGYSWQEPTKTNYELFHLPKSGWVGDVMPYYQDGKFMIYYLNDATNWEKQSSAGEHPIYALSTSNFVDVADEGEIIPYGNRNTQDHLIGTGSMIKVENTYYFYYTGHNGNNSWLSNNNPAWSTGNPREAVMVATSPDGKNWQKNEKPVITAPAGFDRNDFRDPYVFFNEEFQTYWMLVSTRQNGQGVLLVYTNDNPVVKDWEQSHVLEVEGDYLMLECADIFKAGDFYYMLFAEDWSENKGTHYRVASSTNGPWRKPEGADDRLDGHHFYAAKTASNGSSRYAFAWAHRRTPETDNGSMTWAGNLITHEIHALGQGRLGVKTPQAFIDHLAQTHDYQVVGTEGNVSQSNGKIDLGAGATVTFDAIDGAQRVEINLDWKDVSGLLNFNFGNNSYQIRLDKASGRISGLRSGNEVTHIYSDLAGTDQFNLRLLMDGSLIVLYVNDQIALTNRSYSAQGKTWSVSTDQTTANISNIKMFRK